ncbi:MAG: glyoxalase superfamily protein [Sulfuricurvum sp.]|nr:glyoxalase superfamily protein [Sulfuricurvum sp.]
MDSLLPILTLAQLKQITKNTKSALKELGIDLTNSTTLNLVSKGFGFKDYNTAKAVLSKEKIKENDEADSTFGPLDFYTVLSDPEKQDLFDVHLPLIKSKILGISAENGVSERDITLTFSPTTAFLDAQPILQIAHDHLKDLTVVNIDTYNNPDDIIKLVHTYRRYGIKRLILMTNKHAMDGYRSHLQNECVKNNVEFRHKRDLVTLLLILRTEDDAHSTSSKMSYVPIEEFVQLAEEIGLFRKEAKDLAHWYHELNGGWVEYNLLLAGFMFSEKDSLFDIKKVLYEYFVYSLPNYNVGDKTKNDHWESYINKEIWTRDAKKMFDEGIYYSQEIADAIGTDYDVGALMFATERARHTHAKHS